MDQYNRTEYNQTNLYNAQSCMQIGGAAWQWTVLCTGGRE